jgi:hypothetical protein
LTGAATNLSSVSRFRTSTKRPIEEQELHPVATAIAERKNRRSSVIVSWTRTARLLMPARK